ncbi:MAG TPA: alpha/beta hydrolase [Acidimicrobiales bacterium]|nr:alpha/beta hydrolase [Acidimicrobiales bacterium]
MTGAAPAGDPPVSSRRVHLAGGTLEVQDIAATGGGRAPMVLLHEGLGSISIWRDVPRQLADATGRRVVTYSRFGYGRSTAAALPRDPGYMHAEAREVLPALLDELGMDDPVLVGHSDGASIALIHAGSGGRVRAVAALAPHVFVEDCTVEGARAARSAYHDGDLRARLGRHHDHVDNAFYGWNDIWLSGSFRAWSIEDRLPQVRVPVLLIQCADDPYGTLEQLDRIEASVAGPVERLVLPTGGHAPHHADRGLVVGAIAAFADQLG